MDNRILKLSQFRSEFDGVLVEAVRKNSYRSVKMLLEYEARVEETLNPSTIETSSTSNEKSSNAVILAAKNENKHLLKLFIKHQYAIPPPHYTDCPCVKCIRDKLSQSKHRIETMKALSNPVWISLTSDDPFLTAFKLRNLSQKFGKEEDSFEQEYEDVAKKNIEFCLKLLDEIETEAECNCLMRHKKHKDEEGDEVAFIEMAIEYGQKEVVAHTIPQHVVTSIVFDHIPQWRTSGLIYKVMLVVALSITYWLTSLVHILFPCTKIGQIATKPLVKFVNGASSFVTFLILLGVMGATHRDGLRIGEAPCPIEIIHFIWLFSQVMVEVRQLCKEGVLGYFKSGWNMIDATMYVLMLATYITWVILYFAHLTHEQEIRYFFDGVFSFSIILSFFRVVYLCQITRYLGLLQLCLAGMVQVIFQFAFISLLVLMSFSVAMIYLFNASSQAPRIIKKFNEEHGDKSLIFRILKGDWQELPSTVVSLIYANFAMINVKSLEELEDGTQIHLWVNILFVVNYCVSTIVLLNMLIAMMSNSYQCIQENLEVEHKFSRTVLWVDYISDENTRPPPFNLLPTIRGMKAIKTWVQNMRNGENSSNPRERYTRTIREAHDRYKTLCTTLLDRYLGKKFGYNVEEEEVNPEDLEEDSPFLQKIRRKILKWRRDPSENCTCGIDNTGYRCYTAVEGDDRNYNLEMQMNSMYVSDH